MDHAEPPDERLVALYRAQQQSIERLDGELLGLRLWTEALMYSHPAPAQLVAQIEKAREAALSSALPLPVSDALVAAIQQAADNALAIARRVAARAREP